MKRLLYLSLGLLIVMSGSIQAKQVYVAVFKNPFGLKGRALMEGKSLQVPDFATNPNVKLDQFTNTKEGIIETSLDLLQAKNLKGDTYSFSELKKEPGTRVFQVCIKKTALPGFRADKSAGWGFKNAAEVKDQGDSWCFILKKNQGFNIRQLD